MQHCLDSSCSMNSSVTSRSSSTTSNSLRTTTAAATTLKSSSLNHSRIRPRVTAPSAQMQRVDGIDSLLNTCNDCTGILLDQFGVLHDGKVPYPLAVAAVQKLAEAGKQIVILSNSSRRSGGTIGKLAKMGFKEEWFTGMNASRTVRRREQQPRVWDFFALNQAMGNAVQIWACLSCWLTSRRSHCKHNSQLHLQFPHYCYFSLSSSSTELMSLLCWCCRCHYVRGANPQVPSVQAHPLVAAARQQVHPHHMVQQRCHLPGGTRLAGRCLAEAFADSQGYIILTA